jgi:hypothetical protein
VLEALVALLEGCLEAQVEEALGLTYAESEDLDRRLGVPVGLLHIQDAASEEKFWSRVPEEYRALRSIVESVADRRRHSQKNTPGLSADSLSNALRGKGMRKGPWILPADGMVERLSRHFYINPIELVVAWEEVLEKNNSLGALERNESAHEKILEIVFEILGHRWWSSKEAKKRATVGSIDVYDVGAKVRRAGREIEEDLAIDLPLEDWLFDNFAAWTHRLFKGESPCIWLAGRGARGNTLIHRWDVQGAEAESLCHALER